MNEALKWKLIAGFLLVFVAGGITGAALGGLYARQHFFALHHPERIGARMKERLRAELNLTSEQMTKISPIIDNTAVELGQIRRETRRRVHEVINGSHQQIAVNLTDEQRQKLQQIEQRHRGWHRRGFHAPHGESPSATP
jgi:Spy/CpxP family protein refolding chaperone